VRPEISEPLGLPQRSTTPGLKERTLLDSGPWEGQSMKASIETLLPDIGHGDHCCLLFSSPEDQVDVSVPFLAIGLERDERSLYVGAHALIERMRDGLESAGIDVDAEIQKGRLVLSSDRDYLEGGRFNTDKMLVFLQQTYESALAEGFTALRAAGDMWWEVGPDEDCGDIVYYETLLDVFFLGKRMVGMCQYPTGRFPRETLNGILHTHKIAAIDSEICSNFHYLPPELLLEKDAHASHDKRFEWMTSQLLRARRAEEEILRLNAELEERVASRTAELRSAYHDMEAFSYSVSHDLRAPLRAIDGFSRALSEDCDDLLDDDGRRHLAKIRQGAKRMGTLIEDLLRFARLTRVQVSRAPVDMTALAKTAAEETGADYVTVEELPLARGDSSLLQQVFRNLIDNAVKFSRHRDSPRVIVGSRTEGDEVAYFVEDNGAGFDMGYADRLFGVFQRLHRQDEFEGTGIGLAIVHRIIEKHGGRVWGEGRVGSGATFYFTL
jgi:signal transduction histidine kinase